MNAHTDPKSWKDRGPPAREKGGRRGWALGLGAGDRPGGGNVKRVTRARAALRMLVTMRAPLLLLVEVEVLGCWGSSPRYHILLHRLKFVKSF